MVDICGGSGGGKSGGGRSGGGGGDMSKNGDAGQPGEVVRAANKSQNKQPTNARIAYEKARKKARLDSASDRYGMFGDIKSAW